MFKRANIFKWIGWLFSPIAKNGAFFLFMFLLGYLCTQLEIMPYYLRDRGAKPYELSVPELFLDIYAVCLVLMLVPRRLRVCVKALLYVCLYSVAVVDMYCYERFESTLTPTMLMLVGETNAQEAQEFLSGYLSWDVLTSGVGWILLLAGVHLLWTGLRGWLCRWCKTLALPRMQPALVTGLKAVLGALTLWCLYEAYTQTKDNKVAIGRLFSYDTIGQVEHELTKKDQAKLYIPPYRLVFSIYANHLASRQIVQLKAASEKVQIDSCSFRVPDIVLVIGESYNKHHSQLYGYDKPTTPRQLQMAADSSLVAFNDVVASWNLTSFVFKHMMSLWTVGDSGEWCDEPLFPEVFRKAGYRVTFLTNQFQPKAKEAVYDFSGGFFLNDPEFSKRQFDVRNSHTYRYDESLLKAYDAFQEKPAKGRLTILHLMGSHVDYRARYPQKMQYFKPAMYERPELSDKQRRILSDYDNSLRYNDSVVWAVTQRFADKEALVIYVPDHAEEIFDGKPYMYGRMHGANIDYRLARNEMEIPFWIWGSPLYIERHPYGWQAIRAAQDRPMMTDALPHLLLWLAGIATPLYRPELNIIAPEYNTRRPRILKGATDYNTLKK